MDEYEQMKDEGPGQRGGNGFRVTATKMTTRTTKPHHNTYVMLRCPRQAGVGSRAFKETLWCLSEKACAPAKKMGQTLVSFSWHLPQSSRVLVPWLNMPRLLAAQRCPHISVSMLLLGGARTQEASDLEHNHVVRISQVVADRSLWREISTNHPGSQLSFCSVASTRSVGSFFVFHNGHSVFRSLDAR